MFFQVYFFLNVKIGRNLKGFMRELKNQQTKNQTENHKKYNYHCIMKISKFFIIRGMFQKKGNIKFKKCDVQQKFHILSFIT